MPVITHVRAAMRCRSWNAVSSIARCWGSIDNASAALMRYRALSKPNMSSRYTPKRTRLAPISSANRSTFQRLAGVGTTQSCQRDARGDAFVPGESDGTTTGFCTMPEIATESLSTDFDCRGIASSGDPIGAGAGAGRDRAPTRGPPARWMTTDATCSLSARTDGKLKMVVASIVVLNARLIAFWSSTVPSESIPCSMSGSSKPISVPAMLAHTAEMRAHI